MNPSSHYFHFQLEALEPRILLSGDAAELLVPGASEVVEVVTQVAPAEASPASESISLSGEELYPVVEGREVLVNQMGVWDEEGQLLAERLSSLHLAADSVVITDGVSVENSQITATSIYLGEVNWSGGSVLHSDALTLTGAQSGSELSVLELAPRSLDATISLGSEAPGFSLDSAAVDFLSGSGIGELVIGRANGSHAFTIDGLSFEGNLTLRAPELGGHFDVVNSISHTGGTLKYIGSGHTTNLSGDVTSTGEDIIFEDSVKLENNLVGNTVLLDTTDGGNNPDGADILIEGDVLGSGVGNGGVLRLNAGTTGEIIILGNIGTSTDVLDGIIIIGAKNVRFDGNTKLNFFDQQAGTGDTTFGDPTSPAVETLEMGTGDLKIVTQNNITFHADVEVTNGDIDLTVNDASTGTAKIHFKGDTNLLDGDIILREAKNVEFSGLVNVNGNISQLSGTEITIFRDDVVADSISISADQQIRFLGEVRLEVGDLTLTSNDINFEGGIGSIIGALDVNNLSQSNVLFRPVDATVDMDIGAPLGPSAPFQFTTREIDALADGFVSITFGYDSTSTNNVLIGNATFLDRVTVNGGGILVNRSFNIRSSVTLNAAVSGIEVTESQIQVVNEQVQNVWGSSVINLTAAQGDIDFTTGGALKISNNDDNNLAQGSLINLTATNGEIRNATGSEGILFARDLVAVAANAIVLQTQLKTLDASSTTAGDIDILELDDLLVHSATTADGAITISTGAATEVVLAESLTDALGNDIEIEVVNGDLAIGEVLAGNLGDVRLLTEGALTGSPLQVTPHIIGNELTLTSVDGIGEGATPLLLNANLLNATNTENGSVVLKQLTGRGNLEVSVVNDANGSSDHVSLVVLGGDTVINSTGVHSASSAGILLDVAGDLRFSGDVSGNGGPLTVRAAGAGVIDAGRSLTSGGGDVLFDLGISFTQAADAAILSGGGNLVLIANTDILLGTLDARHLSTPADQGTWGNVSVESTTGYVHDTTASATVNIFANELTLRATTGSGETDGTNEGALETDVALVAAITVSGSIALKDQNDLTTGTTSAFAIDLLNEDGSTATSTSYPGLTAIQNDAGDIMLSAGGLLTLTTANAVNTDGASVISLHADRMSIEGSVVSAGGDLSLDSVNDTTLLDAGDVLTSGTGTIAVSSSAGSILAAADQSFFTGSGTILLSAFNALTLGTVETTGAIGLRATNANLLAADGGTDTRNVVTGDTLAIDAYGVNGPSLSSEKLRTNVNTLSLIGGAGPEFQIHNDGTLNIDTTSALVDLYNTLQGTAALSIAPQSDFDVSGNGNIGIVFDTGDGIVAAGRLIRTHGAGEIILNAGGVFTMGSGAKISNENGNIELTANGTVSVSEVASIDGDITVISTTGSIIDSDPAGLPVDFTTTGQLDLTAATGVGVEAGVRYTLNVLLGTLSGQTDTGGIFVTSTAGFATNGLISTGAAPISVLSGGDLVVGPNAGGVAVDAGADLILLADGNLTQLADSTIDAAGDIRLSSGATMTLVSVETPADVAVTALVLTGLPATTATELTANGLFLDQVGTLGSVAQPMRFAIARLAGTVNSGTLVFENDGNLALGQVTVQTTATAPMGTLPVTLFEQTGNRLAVDGIGEGILVDVTGGLTVDAGTGFALTVSATIPVLWQTSATQTWNDAFSLAGGNLTLRAGQNLSFTAGGISVTTGGNVFLDVGQDLTFSTTGGINTGAGSLLARVGDNVLMNGAIISTSSVGLIAGTDIRVTAVGGPAVRVTAADLILNARVNIGNGLFPLTTNADRLSALSGASGIYVDNTGDLEITNLGFGVPSLQVDGTVDQAFSGHQGGVSTVQAGAISVTTTGILTVQEVASVIKAFPGTVNAISIVADQAGPDGNTLNILFDVVTSGTAGNPPTTVYTPETNLLTVTLRNDVSSLQEIIDAINANPDFDATAVLADGPIDGSQIFTIPTNAETAFFAQGGRREGVLVGVSGTFTGGLDAVSAISQILLPGASYNLLFTALNPGDAANAFEVRLLDDGPTGNLTLGANEALVDWDVVGGKLDIYINYGVTTVGTLLNAVSVAQTNDGVPFSAELEGFSVPSDLNDVIGDPSVTLVSNLSASAELRPTGTNNDILITATNSGQLYNQIRTEFVDDGSVATLGVRAGFNATTNLLTVYLQSGVTTANEVMTAIDNNGTFSASLLTDAGGGINTGNGVIQAHIFELHSGAVAVNAFANLTMSGTDNNLVLTADVPGADENGIQIQLIRDDAVPVAGATASYNAGTRVLEVRLNSFFSTAGNVMTVINTAAAGVLTAVIAPGNSGFGAIELADYPETSGGTGGPPEVDFIATGLNNDFTLVADSTSPLLENIQVFLMDDGSITDGSATAVYLSGPRHLILNVQSGVTTLNTLLTVLNDDLSIPVSGTLLAGNDGTGVFNIPAQAFIGGADAVKAEVSTALPSGVDLVLEADVGGVASNGIQVVYAINESLPLNTAAASFFEVDGVRILQIQVQSSTTTLNKIDLALTAAGLPFSVANLGAVGALTPGNLAVRTASVQEGRLSLRAENDISLIGRVQSETGPVSITTLGTGDLTFDSETSRIYAISKAEITLAGSFANLQSTENPLIKVFGDGLLSILAGANTVESELPVTLVSGGDITIGGTGGMSLNDQDLTVDAAGDITISGPIDAGTGNNTFDAEGGITFTPTGSVSGTDLDLTSGLDFVQDGNFTGIGTGTITVTSTGGNITMGANAVTTSDSGNITYTADGNVGITSMVSTTGNIDVVAGGAISDTHASNGNNLTTGGVTTLTAQTGIGSPLLGDLKTQVGELQLRNLGASGDIVITEETAGGNLTITELTQNGASGWSIVAVENGNLTFSGPVTHSGDGSLVLGVIGNLLVQDEINLGGGDLSAGVSGNVTFDKNVNTNGGDVGISSSGILSMDPTMTLDADGGNVLLQATGNVLVSHVLSPDADVRIESTAASVLRAANGVSLNVTARTLQLEAALSIGTLVSEMAAMRTEVTRLNASALNGDLAVIETDALLIGNSSVTVNFAQVDKSTVAGTWNESQLLTQTGSAVLQVGGSLTVETITVNPTLSIDGNFRLTSGAVLTLTGDIEVTNGSAQMVSTLDLFLNGDLDVTGGTLLMQSGGVFTQGAASAITVTDDNAVLSSVGIMTLSRVDTGTGDLALSSDADLLIDIIAPALQLTSSGLRLESGGAIGSVLNPVNLSADTLAALAVNGIHLDVTGDVDVNTVGVTVDMLSTLAVASDYVEANLADIESTNQGNILIEVSGLLELNDGDADEVAVTTTGAGKVFMGAGSLDAYADVRNVDGAMSLVIAGAAHWITTPESAPAAGDGLAAKLLSQTGDLHVVVGAALTMDDQTMFKTVDGSIRIQTTTHLLLGSVQAANGLVALDVGGSILDNGNTHTDVIADELQILSGTGIGVLSPYDAVEIDANLLSARVTTGNMVLSELSAVNVGEVSGSVAVIDIAGTQTSSTVDPLYGLQSLGGGSVSMTSVGNLTVLSGGDPADTEYGISLTNTGNLFLQSSGTTSVLTLNDSVMAGTGHLTLRGNGGIQFAADVSVETAGTGTLSVISGTAGITQVAGSELISVTGDIVLQAATTISLAGITTDARVAVSSTSGAILDNNAAALNISASTLRLRAGLNIATGLDPLEINVGTLSARTVNGAMFLSEADDLDIGSTQALSQVVQSNGSLVSTAVAPQSGLKTGGLAGTIVVQTPAGGLHVLTGHTVIASQAGNILLESRDLLDVEAAITSGTGSITLNGGDINLDGGIQVTTGGAGEIVVGSIDRITTGAESRFVAGTGNVSLAATNDIVLGGITTQGRASVTSVFGDIRAAGSTTFNQEVVASQLALRAEFGGVGTLSPVVPVSAFRTRVGRVAGTVGSGGLNVVNEITVLVDEVSVAVKRVMADGSLQALPTVVLRDLTSALNGSIVLRSTGGSVTLNEGGDLDGKAVSADGTGNVRIYASQNVIVNAAVESATGHVTLRAAGSLTVNSDVSTASAGTVYLRAEAGTLTMLGTATVRATGSNLLLQGSGDVTVGNLVANIAGVTSVNGNVINATGSTLNFSGSFLRLESKTDIGSSLNPLSITATSFSAVSNGGGIYVEASGDVAVGTGSVLVQEVQNDASTLPVTAANQSGLTTTANNGPIVLVSTGGSITVSSVVSAQGSGNILLDANTQLTLDVDLSSGTGNISLLGGTGLGLSTNVDVSTSGGGSIYMDAGTGSLTMDVSSTVSAVGGSLRIAADGDVDVATLSATNTSLISRLGGITKVAGTGLNVSTSSLRISAENSVGSALVPLRISAATMGASSANGGLFFLETDSITVTGVTVVTPKVNTAAGTDNVTDAELADLSSGNNGDIVLVTLAGSITLNDGGDEDFLAVEANGSGSIRLEAPVNLIINSGISSGSGHITLVAGANVTAGPGVVVISTTNPGTVSLRATSGAVTMTGLTQIKATNSALRVRGSGDVTVGTLIATDVSILSISGSVFNATGTTRNVTSSLLRIDASVGVGTALRHLTTATGTLSVHTGSGGSFITELDALTIGGVAVTVTEFTSFGGTTPLTDATQSDLRAISGGDVLLVTGDTLTLGTVTGDIVNLISAGAIVNNTVSTPNVAATSLMLNAQSHIGSVTVPLLTDVDVLSARSTSGDIFIADTGDLLVGAVSKLDTPALPSDTQSDIETDPARTVVLATQGDLSLGRITSGTVALVSGNRILKTPSSTLNVNADALRIQTVNGAGEPGAYLTTRVNTFAAQSENGDILISDNLGITIGSVTVTGLISAGETLTGVTTVSSGDVVILSDNFLTVSSPVTSTGNIRLSAEGVLTLGIVTGVDVSLLSTFSISHPAGLITATNLRVNSQGDVGSLVNPLKTQVDVLSVVSVTGSVFVLESDDATLGPVTVTAGGVTDAAQHGVSAAVSVTLTSANGTFLDGGDSEADIRTPGDVVLVTETGLGATGSGDIEIDSGTLQITSQGNGTVYLHLISTTSINAISLVGNGYLYVTSDTDLTISQPITLSSLGGAYFTIAGSLAVDATISTGRDIRMTATSLTFAAGTQVVSSTGDITIRSSGNLTMGLGASIEATVRSVRIQTGADLVAALISAGTGVDLRAGGNLSGVSAVRATHEISGAALRLYAGGAILPILTNADRMDVNAGAVSEIYELDDLVIGRYGLKLIGESSGDTLTLRMNEAELSSYNGVAMVPGIGTFVWTSDNDVTLGTRLVSTDGDIQITVNSLQQTGSEVGPYVDAANGTVSIDTAAGAGTPGTNPVTVRATGFTSHATTGNQAYSFTGPVKILEPGVISDSGTGEIRLDILGGDLELEGLLRHSGTGTVRVNVPNGRLHVNPGAGMTLSAPLIQTGGAIALALDMGISLTSVSRLIMQAASHSATTRTGSMVFNLRAASGTQIALQNFLIQEGVGTLDIQSSSALVIFGSIQNLANGNLFLSSASFISMANTALVRSNSGILSMSAQELELAQVISLGTSTILRATVFGIKVKPGYAGTVVTTDHAIQMYIPSGRSIVNVGVNNSVLVYNHNTSALVTTLGSGILNYTMP